MTTHESNAAPARRAALRGDAAEGHVVALLEQLAPELAAEPDPAFRTATRQRLVAMAAVRSPEPARPSRLRRLLAARASDGPASRWRTRATAGLAGAALTVTSLATLVALSANARPGDMLYGLKRGTEQTQLALAGDSRGQILLDLARTRLDELGRLGGDAALAESTLGTMDDQTTEGASWLASRAVETGDAGQLDRLAGWSAEQSALLGAARSDVPAAAADDVDTSLALLSEVGARVDGLRVALDCWAGPSTSGTDDLGPVPAECPPVPPSDPGASAPPSGGAPAPVPAPLPAPVPDAPAQPSAPPVAPAPAGPTGQAPTPGGVPVPTPSAPAPSSPNGLLPELLGPIFPTTPRTTTPPPLLTVPLGDGCLELPLLLRLGRC